SSATSAAPVYRGEVDELSVAEAGIVEVRKALPTVTVRGFLNFRTTIDNTVIVFTPAKNDKTERPKPRPPPSLQTSLAPVIRNNNENTNIQNLAYTRSPRLFKPRANIHHPVKVPNHDETLNNIIPTSANVVRARSQSSQSSSFLKTQPSTTTLRATPASRLYPTGLVTILGGTLVGDGVTTVHETSVIGTYIDGKYAQILHSTSRLMFDASSKTKQRTSVEDKNTPSSTPVVSHQATRRPTFLSTSRQRHRFHFPSRVATSMGHHTSKETESLTRESLKPTTVNSISSNTVLQSSFKPPEIFPRRSSRPTQSLDSVRSNTMVTFAIRPNPSSSTPSEEENTVFIRRNWRPSARFHYTPRRRNTNTVRLNRFKVKLTVDNKKQEMEESFPVEEEEEINQNTDIEDSIVPLDPVRVVYEQSTVTSEVTLHVGRRKSVRTLTITTTVPRTIEPSEVTSNDLLENTEEVSENNELETNEILAQHVISRTFSTTHHTWRTSLIPVVDGLSTNIHTITDSFVIRRIITAYRTMPPDDLLLSNSSDIQLPDDIDSSLESTLLLKVLPVLPSPRQRLVQTPVPQVSSLPVQNNPENPLEKPLFSLGATQNPLAALYFGLQQLNQQVTHLSTITKTSSYVTTETVYSTKVVSIYDGRATRFRTLSESLFTTERTLTSVTTTVQPMVNTQALQQQQQLQQLFGTQFLPSPPPQYSTVTSSYTTVTTATSTRTRVYTLIYNAFSTKYRTVTSTSFYPATVTSYSTKKVPLTPTSLPGSFPFFG
ncbi:mucin-2-like, partial [Limulus polyphemus]|uniref:Mucin-2-like n=1 Tax=Limulus polyphemus TaxID=6850 RepID=A0ABM1C070_LIMPO